MGGLRIKNFSNSFAEQDDTDNVDVKFRSSTFECEPCGYFTYSNAQTPAFTFNPSVADLWNTGIGVDAFEEEDDLISDKETAIKLDMTKDGLRLLVDQLLLSLDLSIVTEKRNEIMKSGNGKMTSLHKINLFFGADYRVDWLFPGQNMGPMADPNLLFTYQNTWGPYTRGQTEKDYFSEEEIISAYVMGTLEYDNATVIAGVRVEDTKFNTQGFNAETGNLILEKIIIRLLLQA